jgi:acetyltransferase-like isoleucine patch superfamily enzyme
MVRRLFARLFKKARLHSVQDCCIHSTSRIQSGSNLCNVVMNKHSYCGYDCEISNCDIGAFVSIANFVSIGGGEHPVDWVSTSPAFYEGQRSIPAQFANHKRSSPKKTIIGSDVWIGYGAHIRQGVRIGNGAVVGMGSVVTKDVECYEIVAGVPARHVRFRFAEEVREQLNMTRWWDYPDETIAELGGLFDDPLALLMACSKSGE